jgi:hypothetical protein
MQDYNIEFDYTILTNRTFEYKGKTYSFTDWDANSGGYWLLIKDINTTDTELIRKSEVMDCIVPDKSKRKVEITFEGYYSNETKKVTGNILENTMKELKDSGKGIVKIRYLDERKIG